MHAAKLYDNMYIRNETSDIFVKTEEFTTFINTFSATRYKNLTLVLM